jgi:Fur family ferric uptake transcriptional regulator
MKSLEYINRFEEYLKRENLPLTKQRKRIVQIAFSIGDHFSAEDLADAMKERDVKVGLATIYRTLMLMVSCDIIREHDFGDGFKKYEKTVDRSHHDHLICEGCGEVIEFEVPDIERLQKKVIDRYQFRAKNHKLEIYGLCRCCSEKGANRVPG